jgi:hypothetical protein
MSRSEEEKMNNVQQIFEKAFGVREDTRVYISEYLTENVVVVENEIRKAYYNFNGELLKVINY